MYPNGIQLISQFQGEIYLNEVYKNFPATSLDLYEKNNKILSSIFIRPTKAMYYALQKTFHNFFLQIFHSTYVVHLAILTVVKVARPTLHMFMRLQKFSWQCSRENNVQKIGHTFSQTKSSTKSFYTNKSYEYNTSYNEILRQGTNIKYHHITHHVIEGSWVESHQGCAI